MRKELPITEERLATMREPLSEEAEMVLDLMLSVEGVESEDDPVVREFVAALEGLEDADRKQILYINREIQKAYGRRIKEAESFVSLGDRGMADIERAREIDPEVDTMGEARRLLLQHGIEPQTTEEEMEVSLEMPVEVEPKDWISVPMSEMVTDKNGIPTREAAPDGFGLPYGDEILKLDPTEAEALRLLSRNFPFKDFMENLPEEQAQEQAEARQEIEETFGEIARAQGMEGDEEWAALKDKAHKALDEATRKDYVLNLALTVKEEPDLLGMIDHLEGKDSLRARRYRERMTREMYDEVFEEVIAEKVESGLFFEEVNESGETVLKINREHPEYKAKVAELKKKVEALSPERSSLYEALQHERRGKARMNDFGAMDTVEKLTDAEVVALQPRLRRVRRGLELA